MERDACNYSFLNMYRLKHNTRQTSVVTLGKLLGWRARGTAPGGGGDGGSGGARQPQAGVPRKDRCTLQTPYLASSFLALKMESCATIQRGRNR